MSERNSHRLTKQMDTTLNRLDWDFDKVPANELATCRLWEYARESECIRKIWQQTVSIAFDMPVLNERRAAIHKEFSRLFNALGRASILFQQGIYGFGDKTIYDGFRSPFPQPWQSLSPEQRQILVETANSDVRDDIPLPGFRRADYADAKATVDEFQPKSMKEVFGGDGRVGVVEFCHAGNKLRSISPNFLYADGMEILAVEIDWGECTNEELIKHFAEWLKENEPEGIQRPDRRGHKQISNRVALERLGIMRLLHRSRLADLLKENPAAWKRYNSPNRRWRKDAQKAKNCFESLFPFQNEPPLSWPPKD